MEKTLKQKIFGYSGFFVEQTKEELEQCWVLIENQLDNYLINIKQKAKYRRAYEYFMENPEKYDGATFVKDLFILKIEKRNKFGEQLKIDINAMLHDYEYFMGAYYSFIKITKSNLDYVKNIQACGQGLHWDRFIGLSFISLFYVPYRFTYKIINKL